MFWMMSWPHGLARELLVTSGYAMLRTLASNQGTVKPPVSMSLQHLTRYDTCGMASPTALVCLCHLCPRAEMCWATVICNALQFLWVEQRALSLTIRDDSSDGTSFHLPAILILANFSLDIWALKPMEPRTSVGKFRKGKRCWIIRRWESFQLPSNSQACTKNS